jgi:hypothetical protein
MTKEQLQENVELNGNEVLDEEQRVEPEEPELELSPISWRVSFADHCSIEYDPNLVEEQQVRIFQRKQDPIELTLGQMKQLMVALTLVQQKAEEDEK